ncbi:endonuclease/exonuclease/phosphatase family protein [Streptomyces sp. PSKA54]|uniref:Endonuclease/exonuclease/phosphatase family protein n=2 Tax=Streptomyces TaxID=1883 RepID=A0A7W2D3W8_9ACTN|nr:endonuclease/exonuclease/phosphatase family protein [Streptomyces himalayensis subsp. aureolus]
MPTHSASGSRRRRGLRLVVAALALLGLASAVSMTQSIFSDRSVAAAREVTVASWNMCGVQQWGCAETGSRAEKKRQLKRLATRARAKVILVQEVCAADLKATRKALGPSWRSSFTAYKWRDDDGRKSTVRCAARGQGAAGFGILSDSALSEVTAVASPQPTVGLQRGILCATVTAHRLRICNAHLSPPGSDTAHPDWDFRDDQLKALVGAASGRRTVYGGDLNVDPPAGGNPSTWVWPAGPYTAHRECDQSSASSRSGRDTHSSGHKLDYLFTGLPRSGCDVRDTGASDHRALLIRVRTA